jgi:glutamate N-acetyltransferase/amino-acid N-acetyltransferase
VTSDAHGVTAPRGFLASGISSGIKRGTPDLALIFSQYPAAAAGILTTNRLAAAPVLLARETLARGQAQAVIVNSGNANCCTGPRGMEDARAIRQAAAFSLGVPPQQVLVASTGVIGRFLPTRKIVRAVPQLTSHLSHQGSLRAAQAILTTDLATKSVCVATKVQGKRIAIGGIAKGSGMIDPAMATMLCFLTTDAAVGAGALRLALQEAARDSFNAITVDGQMSTNDMTLVLANGAAGNKPLHPRHKGWAAFTEALRQICMELALKIIKDGEGATRFVRVRVQGASSRHEAFSVAKAIANAPLVKTMVAGSDPNWGRVAATVGAAGIALNPERITIGLCGIPVFRKGTPAAVNRLLLRERFRGKEVEIEVGLGRGNAHAQIFTCDLTERYVRINAKYS